MLAPGSTCSDWAVPFQKKIEQILKLKGEPAQIGHVDLELTSIQKLKSSFSRIDSGTMPRQNGIKMECFLQPFSLDKEN